jgi:hypothetical protein
MALTDLSRFDLEIGFAVLLRFRTFQNPPTSPPVWVISRILAT